MNFLKLISKRSQSILSENIFFQRSEKKTTFTKNVKVG